ncbi:MULTISPECIES: hypothetical protein [Paraburkholderia]|uniref:hypothetical protein n=1 Tax=Paraburkholderia TaxID=1822464 RepID=UPI0013593079|nr:MULTISPECIES: hypothetical protein [Paraburkholderia]
MARQSMDSGALLSFSFKGARSALRALAPNLVARPRRQLAATGYLDQDQVVLRGTGDFP